MPNTGRPSKDCELCRSRRVKCDLGRPACQRCIKYGAECPGYRSLQELVFRNTGTSSAKKRRASAKQATMIVSPSPSERGSSPSSSIDQDGDDVPTPGSLVSSTSSTAVIDISLGPVLNEHWTAHSVPIILELYASVGFLREVCGLNYREGPLLWAAHLFTRTYVTNLQYPTSMSTQSRVDTQQELGTYLGKTLSSVSAAIKSPYGALRDDILATVWILANYELLIGSLTGGQRSSPWHFHTRGLYSLLKSRGNKQFFSKIGRMGFWPAFNMLIQAVISDEECPPESEEWLGIIKKTLQEGEEFSLHVSIFVNRIAGVQFRMMRILRESDYEAAGHQYDELIDRVMVALHELDELYPSGPITDVLHHYMHLMRCSVILKIHETIQLLVNFLTHQWDCPVSLDRLQTQWYSSLWIIRDTAQEILDTIPIFFAAFATGNNMSALFDGLKSIWPLTAICTVTGTSPEQKKAAEDLLVLVGRRAGVRQAFKQYDHDESLPTQIRQPLGFG